MLQSKTNQISRPYCTSSAGHPWLASVGDRWRIKIVFPLSLPPILLGIIIDRGAEKGRLIINSEQVFCYTSRESVINSHSLLVNYSVLFHTALLFPTVLPTYFFFRHLSSRLFYILFRRICSKEKYNKVMMNSPIFFWESATFFITRCEYEFMGNIGFIF